MSAIAYVTDSKMLELHRLNGHRTISFWRLSASSNFSDFSAGDLVFFLSKDREHRKRAEKGIVGFGRLKGIDICSLKTMWKRYGIFNGYNSYGEFKEAIIRVAKDRKVPEKISSFYLENVTFFQPVYLSECGMEISSNIESYIYLKSKVVLKLLDLALGSQDLWTDVWKNEQLIREEKIRYVLFDTHEQIGDCQDSPERKVKRVFKPYLEKGQGCSYIKGSLNELYNIRKDQLNIIFYHDKDTPDKALIGQAQLYKYHFYSQGMGDVLIRFSTTDEDEKLTRYLNM